MQFSKISFKSIVLVLLGIVSAVLAQDEEPSVERKVVSLDPLRFYVDGSAVSDESENQRLWNELMKYKLWGTDSVVFNKNGFRAADPNGYTGTSNDKVIFRDGHHTLGGPIISGFGIEISYPGMDADNDSLLVGPVRAGWLILSNWFNPNNVRYEGTYCFANQVYLDQGRTAEVVNRFIANVHNAGGKIYADWDKEMSGQSGLAGLNLDGSYADCPSDVPSPEKNLSVPVFEETGISWEPAVELKSSHPETQYIHVPPITAADLAESPKHVWFDKYVEDIKVGGNKGKVLYVLMPSSAKNANKKTGRLTRVFSKNGFNFENSANDMKIQVAYVNDEATWNGTTNSWDNVDLSKITVVADSNYAGNLMFYTTVDVEWKSFYAGSSDVGEGARFQGTFITLGNFIVNDHVSVSGQLIAGKSLHFETDVNLNYVPFNSPEINTDVFVRGVFKEKDNYWYPMNFYLTDTAHTEVSFDYCFEFFGNLSDDAATKYARYLSTTGTFATMEDLGVNPTDENDLHYMPFCKDGKTKHIVIKKGQRKPDVPSYISVKEDGIIEGDEYMVFKITNLNGAIISGNKFDGGLVVQLQDSDNGPPHFINPFNVQLAVPENKTGVVAGVIPAQDDEEDPYNYAIVGGSAAKLFMIDDNGTVSMTNDAPAFDYEAWMKIVEDKKAEGKDTALTIDVELCVVGYSNNSLVCDEHEFPINIVDVNEKPYFDYAANEKYEVKIAEDAMNADKPVKTADLDTHNTNGKFTNNIVLAVGGDTDVFGVSAKGVIYAKKTLDYETKSSYTLKLRIQDKTVDAEGNYVYPDLYDEMDLTVTVTDVDDGPKFEYASYNESIDENSLAGTEVNMKRPIKALTTQYGATITYSWVVNKDVGDDYKSFVIDPKTGVVTLAKSAVLDFETKSTYNMKVVASDASGAKGQIVQTDTADVVFKVIKIDDESSSSSKTSTSSSSAKPVSSSSKISSSSSQKASSSSSKKSSSSSGKSTSSLSKVSSGSSQKDSSSSNKNSSDSSANEKSSSSTAKSSSSKATSSSSSKTPNDKVPNFYVRMTGSYEFEIVLAESVPSLARQYAVMDMKGQVISMGELNSTDTRVKVSTRGAYVVKVGLGYKRVVVK